MSDPALSACSASFGRVSSWPGNLHPATRHGLPRESIADALAATGWLRDRYNV
ncbi:hypothetical protein CERZMDRAFT_89978 [Cercospora zeae-maydis SCOH1-5]|uniref:Uncharacterized protein n=1 Tax=Cercospora zeae-maydis SCOH1-5 TaxID=717836 RepID=A0A6A6FQK6_9PEZI|nr:hypothetical protein CERZMDRAFT_89978 [Cercospora zeae-maydis SCOH1-5]